MSEKFVALQGRKNTQQYNIYNMYKIFNSRRGCSLDSKNLGLQVFEHMKEKKPLPY